MFSHLEPQWHYADVAKSVGAKHTLDQSIPNQNQYNLSDLKTGKQFATVTVFYDPEQPKQYLPMPVGMIFKAADDYEVDHFPNYPPSIPEYKKAATGFQEIYKKFFISHSDKWPLSGIEANFTSLYPISNPLDYSTRGGHKTYGTYSNFGIHLADLSGDDDVHEKLSSSFGSTVARIYNFEFYADFKPRDKYVTREIIQKHLFLQFTEHEETYGIWKTFKYESSSREKDDDVERLENSIKESIIRTSLAYRTTYRGGSMDGSMR